MECFRKRCQNCQPEALWAIFPLFGILKKKKKYVIFSRYSYLLSLRKEFELCGKIVKKINRNRNRNTEKVFS